MIIHNDASSPARVLKPADLTDHGPRSTAHLIEPQAFFSLVTGDKADNQKKINATLLNFCTFVKKISTPAFSATGYLAYGIKI